MAQIFIRSSRLFCLWPVPQKEEILSPVWTTMLPHKLSLMGLQIANSSVVS